MTAKKLKKKRNTKSRASRSDTVRKSAVVKAPSSPMKTQKADEKKKKKKTKSKQQQLEQSVDTPPHTHTHVESVSQNGEGHTPTPTHTHTPTLTPTPTHTHTETDASSNTDTSTPTHTHTHTSHTHTGPHMDSGTHTHVSWEELLGSGLAPKTHGLCELLQKHIVDSAYTRPAIDSADKEQLDELLARLIETNVAPVNDRLVDIAITNNLHVSLQKCVSAVDISESAFVDVMGKDENCFCAALTHMGFNKQRLVFALREKLTHTQTIQWMECLTQWAELWVKLDHEMLCNEIPQLPPLANILHMFSILLDAKFATLAACKDVITAESLNAMSEMLTTILTPQEDVVRTHTTTIHTLECQNRHKRDFETTKSLLLSTYNMSF